MSQEEREEILEGVEEEEIEELPPEKRRVIWEPQTPSAFDLYRRYQRGNLVLRPYFQRRIVWDEKKKSRFIESMLLDLPLPYIFLAEQPDGKTVVVDGQQRLNAIFEFLQGILTLKGLTVMTELEGKKFQDLDPDLQDHIESRGIPIVLIKKDSDPEIKFNVFERLNTGAVQLNAQELRNCIYRGSYNDLLIKLSENPLFQELLGFAEPDRRMKDVELVLRFFAFYNRNYENYKKPMKRFLDKEMETHQNLPESEARRLERVFIQTLELVKYIFGREHAFRVIEISENNAVRWHLKPNVALYDIIMYGFAINIESRHFIMRCADQIHEALIILLVHDEKFVDSISRHTSDTDRVKYRFRAWLRELNLILGYAPQAGPRTFSLDLKRELFERNPICTLCHQRIHDIDSAEVHHDEPYWRGGLTIPENARLVHRYCNRANGAYQRWLREKASNLRLS